MTEGVMTFYPVEEKHHSLVREWLHKEHVKPFFYGEGLQNTLRNLDLFIRGVKRNESYAFEHWVAYIDCITSTIFSG